MMKNTRMSKDSHILLNTKMIIWLKKTTLNYEKADLDQLIEKKLVTTQKSKKVDYISFKSTFDMMKQSGFKEVKNGKFEELK